MYALSGIAAHPLLSVAEKMCLIYNACLILTFADDNGDERA